jgi:hypothetical protein
MCSIHAVGPIDQAFIMTVAQLIIVAFSTLGALLFVAAGFLLARSGFFPRLTPLNLKERIAEDTVKAELSSVKDHLEVATKEIQTKKADLALTQQELDKHSEEQVQELATRVRDCEDKRQDMLVELERLRPRLSELDQCLEKVGILESSRDEINALRKSVDELRVENARLHSLELVHSTTPRPLLPQAPDFLGQFLNELLESLSMREGARGAVVADENGFPVAGTGDHTDALATVAAIYDEMAAKVPEILPVSTLSRIDIVDENEVTITALPISIETGRLILVSLSVGPGLERKLVEQLLQKTSS